MTKNMVIVVLFDIFLRASALYFIESSVFFWLYVLATVIFYISFNLLICAFCKNDCIFKNKWI